MNEISKGARPLTSVELLDAAVWREIVGLNVDVIAVIGAVTVRAVQKATSTIPIGI
jgi:hypothetical protein